MSQLNELKNKGFSKLRGIFSEDQIKELNNECLKILESKNIIEYPELPKDIILNPMVELYQNDKSRVNFINQKFRNCIGVSKKIDDLLEIFFSNVKVNEILHDYFVRPKLQFCTIRYADENSNWLGIHSDSGNTISMSILLNNTFCTDPTTVFISGSHLYKKAVKNKIERFNPKIFSNLLDYSTGNAGDVITFFNRTAHGVIEARRNKKNRLNTVILMCFHCDQNKVYRNLLLPEATLYGKNVNDLSGELLKFFETKENDRKDRIKKIKLLPNVDEQIKNFRKLKFIELITYFYLKIFEKIVKTVRFFKRA